jgi:hypothetical protein
MADRTESRVAKGPVRLTLPASVANNLEELHEALGHVAEHMGHPTCFSGCNPLYLELEREFGVGDAVNPEPRPWIRAEPQPSPWIRAVGVEDRVEVFVPDRVTHEIELLKTAITITVGKLGCPTCCSGFDVAFRRESEMIAISEPEVRSFAP